MKLLKSTIILLLLFITMTALSEYILWNGYSENSQQNFLEYKIIEKRQILNEKRDLFIKLGIAAFCERSKSHIVINDLHEDACTFEELKLNLRKTSDQDLFWMRKANETFFLIKENDFFLGTRISKLKIPLLEKPRLYWILGSLACQFLFLFIAFKFFAPGYELLAEVLRLKKVVKWEEDKSGLFKDSWSQGQKILKILKDDYHKKKSGIKYENQKSGFVLDSISDGVLAVDQDQKIFLSNPTIQELYSEKQIKGKNLWEVERNPKVLDIFYQCLKHQKPYSLLGHPIEFPHLGKKYFNISVGPVKNKAIGEKGAVGVFHDITELKSIEKMRADFVANVSHEIRTPLTSIKGFSQVLHNYFKQDNKLPTECLISLDKISRNTKRLEELFNDILHLSIIESKEGLEKEACSVEEVVQDVLINLKQKHANKNVEVELELEALEVFASPSLFEQVVTNYLDNSFKYLQENGKILVHTTMSESEVLFIVRDNGTGIPEESIHRLFERFYRVDPSRSDAIEGTGLGLAIVKHIVQKHGGRVWAESQKGQGSSFYAAFPRN